MDKVTRTLLLYTQLLRGKRVSKANFCLEADCLPRSFDRDIEDIRLFLSETYSGRELLYDRCEHLYYLSGTDQAELEPMEYQLLERILTDTGILRQDEMAILLGRLASNTEPTRRLSGRQSELLSYYEEPLHHKALLKMHGDLTSAIQNQSVIRLQYKKMDETQVEREVIPCSLRYDLGYLYLIAYLVKDDSEYPAYYRLDRIHTFESIRSQITAEKERVSNYLAKYEKGVTQMFGGEFTEIEVVCDRKFYPYVRDKFRESVILSRTKETVRVRLWAFDDGFIKWLLSQPVDMIYTDKPTALVDKVITEAEKIAGRYKTVKPIELK